MAIIEIEIKEKDRKGKLYSTSSYNLKLDDRNLSAFNSLIMTLFCLIDKDLETTVGFSAKNE